MGDLRDKLETATVVTVPEAAELLGISRNHAYELVKSGDIPALRLGTAVRVRTSTLRELLEVKEVAAGA
jgi:excisionase family DNA binding protein